MAAAWQWWQGLGPEVTHFDKPPVSLFFSAIWGMGSSGWNRLGGSAYVLASCWLIHRTVLGWMPDEADSRSARIAVILLAVGLIFYIPAAVVPMAPDLLMIAPHLAAIGCARSGKTAWAGLWAGLAIWTNSKGVLVALSCALWNPAAATLGLAIGALQLLMPGNWENVWVWGMRYAGDTFIAEPLAEGIRRTLNWAGFHAAAMVGVGCYFWFREPDSPGEARQERLRLAGWLLLSAAGVAAGWRFFPRYYFQLLPVVCTLGGLGLGRLPESKRWLRWAALALLVIPVARFGPRYLQLALNGDAGWADTALNRDSREVSRRILAEANAADTILVWGYRPDILVYTRLKLGAPFLDSQPLTGVLADRHFTQSRPSAPEIAASNRLALRSTHPDWLVDGLGLINPQLAVDHYPALAEWRSQYREQFRTASTVVYRRLN